MTDVKGKLKKLKAAVVNDGGGQINPTSQMRQDMADIADWYKTGLGWDDLQLKELRDNYQEALQKEPFDTIADMLSKEAAVCKANAERFFKRSEEAQK